METEMGYAGRAASLYLVRSALDLVRIGVATAPGRRLRALQVGSPVSLELALSVSYPDRRDAEAVAGELARRFADRRVQGKWYRLSPAEVRSALDNRATLQAPAKAAAARAQAAAEAAERQARLWRRRPPHSRARSEKELDYQLRRRREREAKQERAATLLAQEMTQKDVAAAVEVSTRTLYNWRGEPGFRRKLEHKRQLAARHRPPAQHGPVRASPAGAGAAEQKPSAPPAGGIADRQATATAAAEYARRLEAAYERAFSAIETLAAAIERVQELRGEERIWDDAYKLGVACKRPEPWHVRATHDNELRQLHKRFTQAVTSSW